MIAVSFMTANYVARRLGYKMSAGWSEGDRATNTYFAPAATYAERLDELLAGIAKLGFSRIDLWTAHLHWKWATDEHIQIAKRLVHKHHLSLQSYAGGFGDNRAEFEKACDTAAKVGIPLLGGMSSFLGADPDGFGRILKERGLKFGYENHPEKTPADLLKRIEGTDEEVVGAAVDTGWFGTWGYDAAQAIHAVRDRLFYVHLKDVLRAGSHETCRYGAGCVPIEKCVKTLKAIKYLGGVSVEHEPDSYDPSDDCRAGREMLERWLSEE